MNFSFHISELYLTFVPSGRIQHFAERNYLFFARQLRAVEIEGVFIL